MTNFRYSVYTYFVTGLNSCNLLKIITPNGRFYVKNGFAYAIRWKRVRLVVLIVKWLEHCPAWIPVLGSNPGHACVCWICYPRELPLGHITEV